MKTWICERTSLCTTTLLVDAETKAGALKALKEDSDLEEIDSSYGPYKSFRVIREDEIAKQTALSKKVVMKNSERTEMNYLKEILINQDLIDFSTYEMGITIYLPNESGYSLKLNPNGTWKIE
jgi:hypothetical protein